MASIMYRCYHCGELHFAADQARACAESGDDWIPQAISDAQRRAERGPLPWPLKMAYRSEVRLTSSERRLRRHLHRLLGGDEVFNQWWIPGSDYRVDFLIASLRLIIEVDGDSHGDRVGRDRIRSLDLRARGFDIARVTSDHVTHNAGGVAARIAFRVETERIERREVPDDSKLLSARVPQPA